MVERTANRERWRQEVEAWRASGKRLSAWARERNISRDSLEYWKRRMPTTAPDGQCRAPLTLIPLQPVPASVTATAPIELVTDANAGWRIRLPAGFDAASLVRVLDLLESRC